MYYVNENTTPAKELKLPKINSYKSYTSSFIFLILLVIATLTVIVLNGVFPQPVMDLMEQSGLITYTEATNVKVHITKSRSSGRRSRNHTNHDLVGEYRDKDNNKHRINIRLYIVDLEYLDNTYLNNNGNKYPIAYFNFNPEWHYLGKPSTWSCYVLYSVLGILFLYGAILYFRRYQIHSLLKDFSVGKLVRPDSYTVKTVKTKKSVYYKYYVIWDTPDGLMYDSECTKSLKEYTESTEFDDEYCAIYLKNRNGKCLIVHPDDVEKVKKSFGYKINELDVEVSKKALRNQRNKRNSRRNK